MNEEYREEIDFTSILYLYLLIHIPIKSPGEIQTTNLLVVRFQRSLQCHHAPKNATELSLNISFLFYAELKFIT